MRLRRVLVAFVLGAALAIPAQARADWLFTPFIGANLQAGGDALGFDAKNSTVNFGGSLGYMGAGIFGFEVDFGYAPNFFENDEVTSINGNVTTLDGQPDHRHPHRRPDRRRRASLYFGRRRPGAEQRRRRGGLLRRR